jgi:basic membrane lipoprotein Med (substrate-binding protein (PBP1-ABC) superfamily)
MKKAIIVLGLVTLFFPSCISTSIISNTADDVRNNIVNNNSQKLLNNKRMLFVMKGDERTIKYYRKVATHFAQKIGKEHRISVDYVILSPISFTTEEDIKKKQEQFKADYVMEFGLGRYDTWLTGYDITDLDFEQKVLNINLVCLKQNNTIWKAVLEVFAVNSSTRWGANQTANRLVKQLKEDNLM